MELTRLQKILLFALAGMLVFFGVLMAVFRARPGVLFEESLLKITEESGRTVYSGKAHGTPVSIIVTWPANFETDVEFTIGTDIHDVCQVFYPTQPVETEAGYTVNGIRITKNGETLFEGGYDLDTESFGWYKANGEWIFWPPAGIQVSGSGAGPWRYYETTAGSVVRFAFGPETAARGDPALFALAVFLTALSAAQIVFHRQLFRWRHWAARDPAPSEGYLSLERTGWVVLLCLTAGFYIAAMVNIS